MMHLQAVTVLFAAKDGSYFRIGQRRLLFRACLHIKAAVADAEIDTTVRTQAQSVQIMAAKCDADAKAFVQDTLLIGAAIIVVVSQRPKSWDARIVDRTVTCQYVRARTFEYTVEAILENSVDIRSTVTVSVD
jgi:hypothetical protein